MLQFQVVALPEVDDSLRLAVGPREHDMKQGTSLEGNILTYFLSRLFFCLHVWNDVRRCALPFGEGTLGRALVQCLCSPCVTAVVRESFRVLLLWRDRSLVTQELSGACSISL